MKKIKEALSKWRDILCSCIRRLNIVKMSTLPKLIYTFNTAPIKISARLFVDIEKIILKSMWKGKRTIIAKTILKNNKKDFSPIRDLLYRESMQDETFKHHTVQTELTPS